MKKEMKIWEKPQLIIIGRANPEENVLEGCKAIGAFSAIKPQSSGQTGCDAKDNDGNCGACRGRGSKS
jgi:hypothetical protein